MIRAVIDGPAIEAELRRAEAATWGPRPDVGAAAGDYIRRGWDVKPVPRREKRCTLKGWPDLVIGPDDLPRYFRDDANIAVRLGRRSGWLVDCDLDCPEALALADLYLPGTGAEFGRMSKPRSHRLYVAPHAVYEPFADPISGDMLVELRADGREGGAHVTLFPPSVADGERREWHGQVIAPAVIDGASILRRRLACLAIGCLSMRYLSEHAAQRPGPDLPRLLWEFDHELGRAAYRWLGQPDPDAPRLYPRPRHQLSKQDFDLAEIVAAIPNNFDWTAWNKVGLAIYAASGGSGHGFVVFDDFSARSPKYQPHDVRGRWNNYRRSPPARIGMGTLVHLARQAGWRPDLREL
jgi:hypothetical protein